MNDRRAVPQRTDLSNRQKARSATVGRWRIELLPPSPYETTYTADGAVIGFALEAQAGVHAFGSDRRQGFRTKPNGLAYVPVGCDVYSRSDRGGEYLKITSAVRLEEASIRDLRFSDVTDPAAIAAAEGLRRELLRISGIEPLSVEHHAQVLAERVAQVLAGDHVEPVAAAWMTPRRLRLVEDLIDARLDTKLTVQDVADALGLSAGFFSRAFKAAVGKSPYDYVVDRRIARARRLLRHAGQDLSAVAYASGFASHAHMTALFRERLGVPPSGLRGVS